MENRETIRLNREINSRSIPHNGTKSDTFSGLLAGNVRFFGRQNRTEIDRFHNFRTFFYCPCKPFLSRRRAGAPRPAGKGEKVCRQEDLPAGSRRLCHAQSHTGPRCPASLFPRHLRRYRHGTLPTSAPTPTSIVLIIVTFASTAKSVCITVACTSGSWHGVFIPDGVDGMLLHVLAARLSPDSCPGWIVAAIRRSRAVPDSGSSYSRRSGS